MAKRETEPLMPRLTIPEPIISRPLYPAFQRFRISAGAPDLLIKICRGFSQYYMADPR